MGNSEGPHKSSLFYQMTLLGSAALWGGSYLFTKTALEAMPMHWLMCVRMLGACLCMLAVFHRRILPNLNRRIIVPGMLVGLTYWGEIDGTDRRTDRHRCRTQRVPDGFVLRGGSLRDLDRLCEKTGVDAGRGRHRVPRRCRIRLLENRWGSIGFRFRTGTGRLAYAAVCIAVRHQHRAAWRIHETIPSDSHDLHGIPSGRSSVSRHVMPLLLWAERGMAAAGSRIVGAVSDSLCLHGRADHGEYEPAASARLAGFDHHVHRMPVRRRLFGDFRRGTVHHEHSNRIRADLHRHGDVGQVLGRMTWDSLPERRLR